MAIVIVTMTATGNVTVQKILGTTIVTIRRTVKVTRLITREIVIVLGIVILVILACIMSIN